MPFDVLRAIGIRGGIILALALFAALCWYKWGVWKDKFGDLSDEAGAVLVAVRDATGNPKLIWRDVPRQIDLLDASLTEAQTALDTQSERIDQLGAESTRLRAENEALAAKVAKLNRKRDALIAQLEDDALEPGDRADCWAQIRETDEALNQLYREGF
ncbi:hypothetical protein [Sphingopyxis sp.]|jgi:regulator of replication initiation timing|uniref:hypothetical protein n=1 Tax=Sphingopyxis sp. TaxID=1908224 RepID=UPI003F70E4CD